jgi:hypothetical protein
MPRSCSVCDHEALAEINRALAASEPLRNIASRWAVSKMDLIRHRNYHLSVSAIMSQEGEGVSHSNDLLDQIRDLQERTQSTLDRAAEAEELSVALRGIREARHSMKLLGNLLRERTDASRRRRRS